MSFSLLYRNAFLFNIYFVGFFGEGREEEGENIKQVPNPAWSPMWGSISQP